MYIQEDKISQADLAKQLKLDPAKYRINLFTVDKLIEFAQRLDPNLEIKVV